MFPWCAALLRHTLPRASPVTRGAGGVRQREYVGVRGDAFDRDDGRQSVIGVY
jgi:hypothetical protein